MTEHLRKLMQSLARSASEPCHRAFWEPAADVYRCPSCWLVKFDLAGVSPDDVELTVTSRRLTVRGVRRDWVIREGGRSWSMEISYNRFQRSVDLPCELGDAKITTEYRDGMLLVRLTTGGEP